MNPRVAALLLGLTLTACSDGSHAEDQKERTMEFKTTTTIPMELHVGGCEAKLTLQYWQKGAEAEVESTLTNPQCGPSAGMYRLLVRYRDDSGEVHTDEYEESWQRSDAEPIVHSKLYPIGDDVDLVRVRSRGLSCDCVAKDEALDKIVE